ncbi:type II secretory pathway, pseudopilin PulG [Burkholderia pseudomallei]|uniref:type II secretory pathway, pseudopilin PulG n=1 Tax=Burkholderia pseudomallei TaxID=28450 RepID=UPI000A1A1009|nr:type II secretory pathway, pseudopilin PulG [Burkholderia pseudomallei]ARL38881.1 type II secretory pathway, pseudopilin PulG [Burkholderia pseudomallei]
MRHGKRERGIAYLGVLLLVGALALGATQAVRIWKTIQQRDREAQLLFVGGQFRQAIASYYNSAEGSRFPPSLDALVNDRRGPRPLRHLRRVFPDPLTGSRDWGLVEAPEGGVMGVYSRAAGRPLKRQGFPDDFAGFDNKDAYADWVFVYRPSPNAVTEGAATARPAEHM